MDVQVQSKQKKKIISDGLGYEKIILFMVSGEIEEYPVSDEEFMVFLHEFHYPNLIAGIGYKPWMNSMFVL